MCEQNFHVSMFDVNQMLVFSKRHVVFELTKNITSYKLMMEKRLLCLYLFLEFGFKGHLFCSNFWINFLSGF